ncbi:hypothetical protein [Actinopolymorpha pittospori]|uniref:Uncharacterized protein n=1 Tax=Actinopolymorpha pittospori TaxID=648752 RepID=A0A927MNE4_9ACTN|nr:hypothetical protein [Actinopolymorpha pittospori]
MSAHLLSEGVGDLDRVWRRRVEAELADEDERLREHRDRAERLRIARSAAEELARRVPTLSYQGPFTLATLPAAQAALERWSRLPQGDTALADHLATRYDQVATAMTALRQEAETVLAGRQDAWAPLAVRLALWVEQEREVRRMEPSLKIAKAASEFVKRNATVLHNQALEPLADDARSIWGALK